MSSKRAKRRRSCAGKVAYPSEAAASQAARVAQRRAHAAIVHYRCRFCGAFHVGHPPGRVRQSMADRARRRRKES